MSIVVRTEAASANLLSLAFLNVVLFRKGGGVGRQADDVDFHGVSVLGYVHYVLRGMGLKVF